MWKIGTLAHDTAAHTHTSSGELDPSAPFVKDFWLGLRTRPTKLRPSAASAPSEALRRSPCGSSMITPSASVVTPCASITTPRASRTGGVRRRRDGRRGSGSAADGRGVSSVCPPRHTHRKQSGVVAMARPAAQQLMPAYKKFGSPHSDERKTISRLEPQTSSDELSSVAQRLTRSPLQPLRDGRQTSATTTMKPASAATRMQPTRAAARSAGGSIGHAARVVLTASTVALAGGVQPGQSPQDSPEHEYSAAHQCSQADSKRAPAAHSAKGARRRPPPRMALWGTIAAAVTCTCSTWRAPVGQLSVP